MGWKRRVLGILLCSLLWGAENDGNRSDISLNDPIIDELQTLKKERNASAPPANTTTTEEEAQEETAPRPDAELSVPEEENLSAARKSERALPDPSLYLSLKKIPRRARKPVDPRKYLALKKILLPVPEDYPATYLKMKTLLDPAKKYVNVHIDKSRQRMTILLDYEHLYEFKVSTARRGYWTPVGVYRPYTLHRMHYSRKYHHSPMPWSVFFKGGYAIHGTNAIRRLGHPASHGCIRLHPKNARILYQLIKQYGKRNTRIIIRG